MLAVGELVTNAVRHGSGEPRLTVAQCDGVMRCTVHDDSATLPFVGPQDLGAETGRGLLLVVALSTAWGIDEDGSHPHGKSVWFEISDGQRRSLGSLNGGAGRAG